MISFLRAAIRRTWPLFAAGACCAMLVALIAAMVPSPARAADHIRIATQKTGTLAWELSVMKAHGLDRKANLSIDTDELASTEAGKVALRAGSADVIVSDWLWVARERALGSNLVFYPYSSTLGAVMVPEKSSIATIADLKGKKLGVAGGPLDKSWLLLRALALRSGIDLNAQADIVYGAPPLLSAEALRGQTDATLTFWNFCANLESQGMRQAIGVAEIMKSLGAEAAVPMLGYVFDGQWGAQHRSALRRFFAAAMQAKEILASSPAEWQSLAPYVGTEDANALAIYRKRYSEGIPRRSITAVTTDARALYLILAKLGGRQLVGPTPELDPGTFYSAEAGE